MKLLLTSDWHLRDSSPINRLDNFYDTQFNKLEQIVKIFKDEKCDYVIHAGDVFDSHRVSFKLLLDTISFFQKHNLIVYGIVGNHDCQAFNLGTLNNSALGILMKLGTYVDVNNLICDQRIKGIHTRLNYDKSDYCDADIIVSHDMILTVEDAPFDHVYYKDLDGTAKVILSGHYHRPSIIQGKKTLFINTGSLTRMSTSDDYVVGVDILDTKTYNVKRIELDIEPYEKVFRQKEESGNVLEIGTVELDKVNKDNMMERIVKYAKDNEYSSEVIDNVVLRVKKAREEIQ